MQRLLPLLALAAMLPTARAYDPLALPAGSSSPETVDFTVTDSTRQRDIPIRVYLPAAKTPSAAVLFSHGLGGSREGSPFLGKHWAGRGYVAVFLQHPGSDTSVWRDKPVAHRMDALREAANLQQTLLRFRDVPAVIDQLKAWNEAEGHALHGRLDLARLGMSGHSFGAVTTQAVSGQKTARGESTFTDPRIKAAVIMSPSSPKIGTAENAFGGVKLPWMLMTGTKDTSPIGDMDVASRLAVYPALPAGQKYELVLDGAEHSVFTERALPGESGQRNPNHHRAILALSTAFWDAYLKQDAEAKVWLDGEGAPKVLEAKDRWQTK